MIPYSRQEISKTDLKEVSKTLKSNLITQGPKIIEFEKRISKYVSSKYCCVSNSGTSALHAACFAIGLKKNDIVWTTPISFVASSNCALYLGARINFIDIDIETGLMDFDLLENKLKKAKKNQLPKLIIIVHYAGQSADIKKLNKLKKIFGFKIIEDASHAIGSEIYGNKVGSCKYSDITTFSFHPVKNITTGEGGASTTNKKTYLQRLKSFSNHGINKSKLNNLRAPWEYNQIELGFNYRLTDFQASLGISQLKKISVSIQKKIKLKKYYDKNLDNLPIKKLKIYNENNVNLHLYVIRLRNKKTRLKIYSFLLEKGIKTQVHYIPIYKHEYYKNKNYFKCPNTEKFYETCLSIPFYSNMTMKDSKKIIAEIKNFFKAN